MVTLISQRTAEVTKRLRRHAQVTKHLRYLDDSYVLLRLTRDAETWDAGDSDERYTAIATGRCKVYANGVGGPRMTDVIYPESPYRVRLLADEFVDAEGTLPDLTGTKLIVNQSRVFIVDDLKVDDDDDLLADLYVHERPGKKPPEVI